VEESKYFPLENEKPKELTIPYSLREKKRVLFIEKISLKKRKKNRRISK
jgi:hypothetical protein